MNSVVIRNFRGFVRPFAGLAFFTAGLLAGVSALPGETYAQVQANENVADNGQNPADTDVPLTGAAFKLASEAYDAYNRGNYDEAIDKVREAIRQRPDVVRLKILLVDALEASGQIEQAERAAQGFVDTGIKNAEISGQLNRLRGRLAQKPAEEAYRALERGDIDAAADKARDAVEKAPDIAAYHLLLINTLLRKNAYKDAAQAATDALALDSEDANSLVMRAYARQKMGETAKASADFDQALAQDWLSEGDLRSIRLIAVDAAIAAHDEERAKSLIASLDAETDDVKARLQQIEALSTKGARRNNDDFAAPFLDCRVTPYGQVCTVLPGIGSFAAEDPGYSVAVEAYRAFGQRNYALAATKAREALELSPENRNYRSLLSSALSAQKNAKKPGQRVPKNGGKMGAQASAAIDPAYAAALKISMLKEEKRDAEARAIFDQALHAGILNTLAAENIAYLATTVGDKETANEKFGIAYRQGRIRGMQLVDAAYAARRVYDNKRAIELLKKAIDEVGDTLEPQELFNLRREVATLSRTWGFYQSISHGSVSTMRGDGNYASTTQTGTEVYWRPAAFGYRDGALVELFARQFTTLHDQNGGPTGFSTMQGSFGVRWKPAKDYNFVVEAARLFKVGDNSRNDTMLRMAFSEGRGMDLRVDVPSWMMWQVYGEFGHYIENKQTFASFEARFGRSYRLDKISDRLVVTPFISAGGNYDSLLENMWAIGAGPGVNMRWWFREDKYTAPMSYVDANVQYRFKLHGDDRAKGLFAGLTMAY